MLIVKDVLSWNLLSIECKEYVNIVQFKSIEQSLQPDSAIVMVCAAR
jgi:hypothetical protein